MIVKLRQASETKIAFRAISILANTSPYSIFFARKSFSYPLVKLKNRDGNSANNNAIPPVRMKATIVYVRCSNNSFGFAISSFNASIANNGIQNSAITRILDTVRNLLYIGK